MNVCMYVCMYVCVCLYVCVYVRIMYICMYVRTCVIFLLCNMKLNRVAGEEPKVRVATEFSLKKTLGARS